MKPAATEVSTIDDLLKELERLGRQKKPGMRQGFYVAGLLSAVPIGIALIADGLARGSVEWPIGGVLIAGSIGLTRITLSRRQRDAARRLAAHHDVRAVGPLAEALGWPDPHLRQLAVESLTKLLPLLQPADTHLLNDRQRECLYRELHFADLNRREGLVLAILGALREVGDTGAIPSVEGLVRGPVVQVSTSARSFREIGIIGVVVGAPPRPAQQRIMDAAQECLSVLRVRADGNRAPRVLLRPAAPNPDHLLLRPASEGQRSDPAALLRPALPADRSDSASWLDAERSPEASVRLEASDTA